MICGKCADEICSNKNCSTGPSCSQCGENHEAWLAESPERTKEMVVMTTQQRERRDVREVRENKSLNNECYFYVDKINFLAFIAMVINCC